MTKLNPEVKQKWIDALRSGEYAQETCELRQPTTSGPKDTAYCCLGVLCAIQPDYAQADPDGGHGFVSPVDRTRFNYILPKDLADLYFGGDQDPTVNVDGRNIRLSMLNDNGNSFTDIADLIEASL